MVWHANFLTHKHVKLQPFFVVLHHLATLFDNTNAVIKPEQDDDFVHCVFFRTFMKFCQIHCQVINNILQLILPEYCQNSANFISLNYLL